MQYICFLFEDGEIISQHILNLPKHNEKDSYIQGISFHYFDKREATKHLKSRSSNKPEKGRKTLCFRKEEWDLSNHNAKQAMEKCGGEWKHPWSKIMMFEHNSVFDFYDAIGYDYKSKRYLEDLCGQ